MGSRQQNLQSVSVLLFQSIQGEIQFPTLHFACQGATGLQGAASGWAAGLGEQAMPEGPQDATQHHTASCLALQGWITLKSQRPVCSH